MNTDHLAILEKLCNNINKLLTPNSPEYLYSAAIAQLWMHGSPLEKNLYNTFTERIYKEFVKNLNRQITVKGHTDINKCRLEANTFIQSLNTNYEQAVNNTFITNAIKILTTKLTYSENEVIHSMN